MVQPSHAVCCYDYFTYSIYCLFCGLQFSRHTCSVVFLVDPGIHVYVYTLELCNNVYISIPEILVRQTTMMKNLRSQLTDSRCLIKWMLRRSELDMSTSRFSLQ